MLILSRCAGGEKGKDACEGDGGAPLVCQSESGLWHVVGLVAWGVDCALEDVPGVYVNIYKYIDFITQRYWAGYVSLKGHLINSSLCYG